jgi:hypothetical protein
MPANLAALKHTMETGYPVQGPGAFAGCRLARAGRHWQRAG